MSTFFVIRATNYSFFDMVAFRMFASRGKYPRLTSSLNDIKHFSSRWSAENWLKKLVPIYGSDFKFDIIPFENE